MSMGLTERCPCLYNVCGAIAGSGSMHVRKRFSVRFHMKSDLHTLYVMHKIEAFLVRRPKSRGHLTSTQLRARWNPVGEEFGQARWRDRPS